MFQKWIQLRRQRSEISTDSLRRSTQFSCTSFKDIQDLISEDSSLEPNSPRRQILHQPRSPRFHSYSSRAKSSADFLPPTLFSVVDIPNADNRDVVIYFTSLRIVRKTFEECRAVKSILHGFRIPIDERDLSMDSRFQDELQTIFGTKRVGLPRVFIGGKYIGGAEEIKQLQERGELKKIISALPLQGGKSVEICDLCRGWRFTVCEMCNGSHKIYSEKTGFKTCTACSVYGLIKCASCLSMHRRRNL